MRRMLIHSTVDDVKLAQQGSLGIQVQTSPSNAGAGWANSRHPEVIVSEVHEKRSSVA